MSHSSPPVLQFELHVGSFALLDDAHAKDKSSRLFTQLLAEFSCTKIEEWDAMWSATQESLEAGNFAVALLQYETGAQLQQISSRTTASTPAASTRPPTPSRVLIFKECRLLDTEEVGIWLGKQTLGFPAGISGLQANVDETTFADAIHAIQKYIASGDTYQVNYTYRLHFNTYGTPASLYLALRERQPVPYGAFIRLSNDEFILSFSPELFVRHQQGKLIARPMKGTSAATGDALENTRRSKALSLDEKNRAENVMIVDLLRNDLGRIAQTGSVNVPQLFEVNRFSSVLQMTSTIEALVRPELSLSEVMRALFPCGSITGAPKKRTMEVIQEIETEDRGLYTGAIGWFDPIQSSQHLPDFCLSVPIRTLELQAELSSGERRGRMGVGAGIVYDSEANEEYAECQLKAKFLTGLTPIFTLFETMYATREEGCRVVDLHLERLRGSAQFFGFHFDEKAIRQELKLQCTSLNSEQAYRVKLSLQHSGEIEVLMSPLPELNTNNGAVAYLFENEVCTLPPIFLAHKTSVRQQYDSAWQRAEQYGAFDSIFVNGRGHITEGGRSTVFVRLGTNWYTPPLSDGVLPGIMRSQLLEMTNRQIEERSITVKEFLLADEVMLANSLRGLMLSYRGINNNAK